MSLPSDIALASEAHAPLLAPDDAGALVLLEDLEMGGVALNNGAQGLQVRIWEFLVAPVDQVRVRPLGDVGAGTLLLTLPGVERIAGSFDRNMNPVLAYVLEGECFLWWYDVVAAGMVTTAFPGAQFPHVSHDDKRDAAATWSDVIFGYVREGTLYWRQQRDRYQVEYEAGPSAGLQLARIGMSKVGRFQFELV